MSNRRSSDTIGQQQAWQRLIKSRRKWEHEGDCSRMRQPLVPQSKSMHAERDRFSLKQHTFTKTSRHSDRKIESKAAGILAVII